jgi:hypothetical protein
MRRALATLVLLALGLGVGGCSGQEFRQDRRLTFRTPTSDALTHLPVTVSWSMKDFTTSGPTGGRYAVFVDRQPIKVGHNVDSVLPSGTKPSATLLANANVYVTATPDLRLTIVPDLSDNHQTRQRHTATVVLLDPDGTRSNESAWSRSFDLDKTD